MTSPLPIKSQAQHLYGIHALRGVAALLVFCFHLHYVGQIPLPKSWGLIATHGGSGVQLFFALSAFSLLYSNQRYVSSPDSRWVLNYIIKRFFRIAPLFYFMLIVHCLLITFIFNGQLNLNRILLSVFFIFNFVPSEAEGIVWASWSIGVEMIFYAVLPLIMVSVRSLKMAFVLWFLAIIVSCVYRASIESDPLISNNYKHFAFMSQFGVFTGGVLGFWIFTKLKSTELALTKNTIFWWLIISGPILALLLLSSFSNVLASSHGINVQLWGLVYGSIAALAAISNHKWMAHSILQHFGERSYSLYLTHALVIYGMAQYLKRLYEYLYPTLGGYGFAICAMTALIPTLVISEFTYRLIEVTGIKFGKGLENS